MLGFIVGIRGFHSRDPCQFRGMGLLNSMLFVSKGKRTKLEIEQESVIKTDPET